VGGGKGGKEEEVGKKGKLQREGEGKGSK